MATHVEDCVTEVINQDLRCGLKNLLPWVSLEVTEHCLVEVIYAIFSSFYQFSHVQFIPHYNMVIKKLRCC